MKKLLLFAAILIASAANAQECNTMWPYMFQEFTKGKIYFIDGRSVTLDVNIHYIESHLHYLDHGTIKQTDGSKIRSVSVEDQDYIFIESQLIKVEAACQDGFVGTITLADLDRLNEASGAYGTSSNVSATRNLSSLEKIGGTSTNTNHMELSRNRNNGETLYLEQDRYLVLYNTRYKATRSAINRSLSREDKKLFKSYLKQHDIDWDSPESILTVIDFLKEIE